MKFFSKTTGGFYAEDVYGDRKTTIPDPAWVRPCVDVTLQPDESFPTADGKIENLTTEPMVLTQVEDWRAVRPLIEIGNPACLMPADVVDLTDEEHATLLAGQSGGKLISADNDGRPVLVDRPAPTDEYLATLARADRDARLAASDWAMLSDAPLTASQKTAWTTYRQALRNVPAQSGFPSSINWPALPS